MVQKIYSKLHPVPCTNTHHDVTDMLNHGMVENIKTWISWERNITFAWNKKILNLCVRWHILRSYRFVAEVTFKELLPGEYLCTSNIFPIVRVSAWFFSWSESKYIYRICLVILGQTYQMYSIKWFINNLGYTIIPYTVTHRNVLTFEPTLSETNVLFVLFLVNCCSLNHANAAKHKQK